MIGALYSPLHPCTRPRTIEVDFAIMSSRESFSRVVAEAGRSARTPAAITRAIWGRRRRILLSQKPMHATSQALGPADSKNCKPNRGSRVDGGHGMGLRMSHRETLVPKRYLPVFLPNYQYRNV